MNKKIIADKNSKFFDLTALRVPLSVILIYFASMMSEASIMARRSFNVNMPEISIPTVKSYSCPAPLDANYCAKVEAQKSCGVEKINTAQGLIFYANSNASSKSLCSSKEKLGRNLNES